MLQMDSQWTTLLRSYRDNYLEYKVTGDPKYQKSVDSAKEGLDNIMTILKDQVDTQTQTLSQFNATNSQTKISELKNQEADLKQDLMKQQDELKAAEIRQQPDIFHSIPTSSIIGISVLTAIAIGLSML